MAILTELYRHDRVEILKEVAPSFFGHVQRSLLDDTIQTLCRLGDKDMSSNENMVMSRLITEVSISCDSAAVVASCSRILDELYTCMDPLRKHRNKRIGHLDYPTLSNNCGKLLDISMQNIRQCLTKCKEILNTIYSHYTGSNTRLWETVDSDVTGDATRVIGLIKKS